MPGRRGPATSSTGSEAKHQRQHWVWVFGEIDGLRWVLERQVMAFAEHAGQRLREMNIGDAACLYVTRGAFHNPTRDRARLAGLVKVTSRPRTGKPVKIAGRAFSIFVGFEPVKLIPERQGPDVANLVHRLERVKRPEVWGHYFRNSPIRLSEPDFCILEKAVLSWKAD